MTIGTALIGLALLVFAGIFVTQPLQSRSRRPRPEASAASGREYETTLLALRDLELDHELGVVEAAEYARLRAQLMSQAAQALQQTEQTQRRLDAAIETAVRARRTQGKRAAECPACQKGLGVDDKFCPHCGTAVAARCSNCHQLVAATDKFCTGCGTHLVDEIDTGSRR